MLDITCLGDSITAASQSANGYGYREALYWELMSRGAQARFRGSQHVVYSASANAFIPDTNDPPLPWGDHEGHPSYYLSDASTGILEHIEGYKTAAGIPAAWIVIIGTNDSVDAAHADVYSSKMLNLIDALPGKIVWCKIPPQVASTNNARIAQINGYMQANVENRVSAGRQITLVDLNSILSTSTDFADNAHPNDPGYRKIAAALAPALASF